MKGSLFLDQCTCQRAMDECSQESWDSVLDPEVLGETLV